MCSKIVDDLTTFWNDAHGRIYKITHNTPKHTISFLMIDNRYCKILKDEHKSNNIWFQLHTDTLCLFQHCFDPVCRLKQPAFVTKYTLSYLLD